jgi:methylase of polypeptide subunit release factors
MELIRRMVSQLARGLAPGGSALVEIGAGQTEGVLAAVAAELPGWPTSVHRDLAGIPRVVRVDRRLPS